MRIGAIVSMKQGLESFVYRELTQFSRQGLAISLFPTKAHPGLYNPSAAWSVHRWSAAGILGQHLAGFLRAPLTYLRLLAEALQTRALPDFALAWAFARPMREVDVIYATFGDHKLFVGYFCKRILHKPLVVTIHAYELYQNPNPRLFRRALAACDRIITVTEVNRERLAAQYGIPPAAVDVVRINVDLEDYRPRAPFVVLIVAFFAERKGHEILFQALKELDRPDAEVWVVGDQGAERGPDVRKLAVDLGVSDQVAFFGALSGPALKAVYRACDVFCLPCHTDRTGLAEGFPTVLAEAMAFGKPVVTTRHVEIPRIVPEIIVVENDVAGLAQALRELYDAPERRASLGARNRRLAEQLFSTANAGRTAAILGAVAAPPAARPGLFGPRSRA
jgi:glycosyltransferase involved in cell wall biosynthesis